MNQLYQMYVEELSSVCYRYVPDENDAKDVLQNSFIKIFTSVTTMDYRSEKAFNIRVNEEEQQEDPDLEQISPDELHRLISELPIGYRMVINLYVFEDYSHRQIAELLSISERTSASQFYYAKRLLARKIKELTKDKR